jgi:hypothetical protein
MGPFDGLPNRTGSELPTITGMPTTLNLRARPQGAAAELGVTGPVSSPRFVLIRRYRGTMTVHHMAVYRSVDLVLVHPKTLNRKAVRAAPIPHPRQKTMRPHSLLTGDACPYGP